ncbi:MAG: hypothetical protein F6K62_21990, partial [Sphaerospermopsis sp. SIO1G2]|nr:hypothetical protein [Sphaerospermopsis sp. SIO1G2]
GDTVEEIVLDKRGIIKTGQAVISGCTQPTVQALVAEQCDTVGATLHQLGTSFSATKQDNSLFTMNTPYMMLEDVELGMSGDFQAQNGVLALMAAASFAPDRVTETAVRNGLAKAKLAGRMEIMQERPLVLIDGAHNPDKIRGGAGIMSRTSQQQRVITVMGLKAGKDATDILPPVLELTDTIIFTSFGIKGLWSAVPAEELAAEARVIAPDKEIQVVADVIPAVEAALELANPEDIVWITGSLYLAGDAREYWYPSADMLWSLEKVSTP